MINRVLVAGKLTESPRTTTTPNGIPLVVLILEVRHPRWTDEVPDVCSVEVHAVGEKRAEVLVRYMEKGRDLMVEGQLREHGGKLHIALDRFHFMERGLSARYLWAEAYRENAAA